MHLRTHVSFGCMAIRHTTTTTTIIIIASYGE
jgi:hypothetical protein